MADFDFDWWKDLYEKDPTEFCIASHDFINDEVDKVTDDPKRRAMLRGMVWQFNLKHRKIIDPTARLNAVIADFWKELEERT